MLLKLISPRTLLSRTSSSSPSPYSIFIAQCSTSSPYHLTYPHSHSHLDPRNVRVSVWWDLENCNVPSGVNVFRGAQAITAAIESSGIKGPIQITAFGDMLRLARTNQEALSSTAINFTGINFTHIPHGLLPFYIGGEHSANSPLFRDLMHWVSKNPPPAHLFLITVDGGPARILDNLRRDNYNILLASKKPAHASIAATIMWNWDALLRGENLTGRYFNQPPKGSWYGHYEGPLVFSQDSFWRDLQSFFNTDIGSFIIAESRIREKMAYHLRKYGPSVLKSLMNSDVLLMVDMLLSEKKWVLESHICKLRLL